MLSKEMINMINNIQDKYIVVGVSSGPDSMALLHMLKNNTNKEIICTHINHNIRKSSDLEEAYLKDYCKNHNIIFETTKIDKYTEANFENEARTKRYQFYEKILTKYHSHYLFLAHHGDDLIETVMMKIIRGSNLEGYAGIKTYSKLTNYTIIRPLLSFTKEELINYNKKHKIKYYIDNTNYNEEYTRNRYRKNILPILKKEDNNVHLKFLKYSNTLQEYYNYVEEITKEKIKIKYNNNTININKFNKEHNFIKKNIIFYILSNIYNNKSNIIKDKHIDSIIKLTNSHKPNQIISLPNNYQARKSYDFIYIEKKEKNTKNYKILLEDYQNISNIIIKKVDNIDSDGNNVCRLSSKDIKLPLYIRNRTDGDYIYLYNSNHKKKIKDIFIDEKIPLNIRNTYPLLVDSENNILWIPNIKKSKYNVKKNEIYDIILTSYKESEENNEKKTK